jgi:hypothetical protein
MTAGNFGLFASPPKFKKWILMEFVRSSGRDAGDDAPGSENCTEKIAWRIRRLVSAGVFRTKCFMT